MAMFHFVYSYIQGGNIILIVLQIEQYDWYIALNKVVYIEQQETNAPVGFLFKSLRYIPAMYLLSLIIF